MPQEIYIVRLSKQFRDVFWKNKTDQTTQLDKISKTNNCLEKGRDEKALKAATTKNNPREEDNDDTRSVFSNLTFTAAAVPTMVQAYSDSAAMGSSIPGDPTIKCIVSSAGAQMQVSSAASL